MGATCVVNYSEQQELSVFLGHRPTGAPDSKHAAVGCHQACVDAAAALADNNCREGAEDVWLGRSCGWATQSGEGASLDPHSQVVVVHLASLTTWFRS
jgi:hypothetical protein